jgi:hypothetical protein
MVQDSDGNEVDLETCEEDELCCCDCAMCNTGSHCRDASDEQPCYLD